MSDEFNVGDSIVFGTGQTAVIREIDSEIVRAFMNGTTHIATFRSEFDEQVSRGFVKKLT